LIPASYKREEAEAAGQGETDKLHQVGPLSLDQPARAAGATLSVALDVHSVCDAERMAGDR
jgi:hypothetical protein